MAKETTVRGRHPRKRSGPPAKSITNAVRRESKRSTSRGRQQPHARAAARRKAA